MKYMPGVIAAIVILALAYFVAEPYRPFGCSPLILADAPHC